MIDTVYIPVVPDLGFEQAFPSEFDANGNAEGVGVWCSHGTLDMRVETYVCSEPSIHRMVRAALSRIAFSQAIGTEAEFPLVVERSEAVVVVDDEPTVFAVYQSQVQTVLVARRDGYEILVSCPGWMLEELGEPVELRSLDSYEFEELFPEELRTARGWELHNIGQEREECSCEECIEHRQLGVAETLRRLENNEIVLEDYEQLLRDGYVVARALMSGAWVRGLQTEARKDGLRIRSYMVGNHEGVRQAVDLLAAGSDVRAALYPCDATRTLRAEIRALAEVEWGPLLAAGRDAAASRPRHPRDLPSWPCGPYPQNPRDDPKFIRFNYTTHDDASAP